ncbi:hypothetical protein WR25_03830 isoform C [Diploscapter pachys]|uniref:C2 domain-containing protein n=1 Tax=Diploscapter pachys TaxID=2018661 RepID=A0A2A2KZ19_9BILA|nr:hypothetical protein WR25_03830 isoform A [Diploscapter pachys]PAV79246.1 hypothetical protein WR25_03830 isoform B [Diploscapter pachys]PAV79247.1 hypothetical protein WR25_03830 isoform C [Diploscapter pachys]
MVSDLRRTTSTSLPLASLDTSTAVVYSSAPTTSPSRTKTSDGLPPGLTASIDKTMADIENLLESVYTTEGSKPNLLMHNPKQFAEISSASSSYENLQIGQAPPISSEPGSSPSFLLPWEATESTLKQSVTPTGTLGSGLSENRADDTEPASPRGLKRSPAMMMSSAYGIEPSTSSVSFPSLFGPQAQPTLSASAEPHKIPTVASLSQAKTPVTTVSSGPPPVPNTIDQLTASYKWLQEVELFYSLLLCLSLCIFSSSLRPAHFAYSLPPPFSLGLCRHLFCALKHILRAVVPDAAFTCLPSHSSFSTSIRFQFCGLLGHQPSTSSYSNIFLSSSVGPTQAVQTDTIPSRPGSALSIHDLPLSRPGSSASGIHPSSRSAFDPTIIPGAPYQKPKAVRQTVSAPRSTSVITSGISSTITTTAASATSPTSATKIPNTLARVLLKKELREVLNRRKEQLEACEIEANQRQYIVHKMLVTGLLPENHWQDDIPRVITCQLPPDLIRGARVIPPPKYSVGTQKDDYEMDRLVDKSRQEARFRQDYGTTASTSRAAHMSPMSQMSPRQRTAATHTHSIGIQSSDDRYQQQQQLQQYGRIASMPPPRLTEQLDMGRRYTPKRTTETQTENYVSDRLHDAELQYAYEKARPQQIFNDSRYGVSVTTSRSERRSRYDQAIQRNDDLLEATKRYFEDYDRQLREMGERNRRMHRRHFDFNDDDPVMREARKQEIMEELARRRERMCSSCELLSDNPPYRMPGVYSTNLKSSDYSSTVPHYGSLPRNIDYQQRLSPLARDFTYRESDRYFPQLRDAYGSLPRNYERYFGLDPTSTGNIQIDQEQSFGNGAYSFGYGRTPMQQQQQQRYGTSNLYNSSGARSLYNLNDDRVLNQPTMPSTSRPQQPGVHSLNYLDQLGVDARDQLRYSDGVSGYRTQQQPQAQSSTILPQYANYLSQQFQAGLNTMQPTSYDMHGPPLSDPLTYNYPSNYPMSRQSQILDPLQAPHVYSRSEANYGSRPPEYPLDYGNLVRNQPPPDYGPQSRMGYSAMAGYDSMMNPPYDSMGNTYAGPSSWPYSHNQQPPHTGGYGPYSQAAMSRPPPAAPAPFGVPAGRVGLSAAYDSRYPHSDFDRMYASQTGPGDDALSRVYATAGRRREVGGRNREYQYQSHSLGRLTDRTAAQVGHRRPHAKTVEFARRETSPYFIKRILLTRRYKHHNIYNDLGVRVIGGKKMANGELGAFVSAVNPNRNSQLLGEIREGDQVLEWNGILLNGKTFEEVERIINSSTGEVEIILRTERERGASRATHYGSLKKQYETDNIYGDDRDFSPERSPPIPMHQQNGNIYPSSTTSKRRMQSSQMDASIGHLQLALSYDKFASVLSVRVLRARGLRSRDPNRVAPNPFVKVYLMPGRNIHKVSGKRRTRYVQMSTEPEWNQLLEYGLNPQALRTMMLEFSVWDYDKDTDNLPLGKVTLNLADSQLLNGVPRWYQVESEELSSAYNRNGYGTREITSLQTHYPQNYKSSQHTGHYNGYNPAVLDIGYPAIN